MAVAAVLLAAALVDLAYQRWQYLQDLKMTRREFLQDLRQMESGRQRRPRAREPSGSAQGQPPDAPTGIGRSGA